MFTEMSLVQPRAVRNAARLILAIVLLTTLVYGLLAFVPSAEAAVECRTYHTVQSGETLYRIGLKYNLTWDKIATANNIKDGNKVNAGQVLCIPKSEANTDGKPAPDVILVLGTEVQYILALTDVNMRVAPGVDYKVMGKIFAGQTAKVTGVSSDGNWWRVVCPDGSTGNCWVSANRAYTEPTGGTSTPPAKPTPGAIPTISISTVVKDQTVTITAKDLPANMKFDVRMGKMGTQAIGGTYVTTIDSGKGGTFSQTFTIPAGLRGQSQIAIRLDGSGGYYSYNWFWNNSTN